jgi:excisionase family DNA binding protein
MAHSFRNLNSARHSGMTRRQVSMERLISVDAAAEILGTSARFPRRLIAERRIRFVRVGRHVRIPESAITEYIEARTVPPLAPRRAGWAA